MTANPLSTIPPIGPTTGMAAPPPPGRFKPVDPLKLLRKYALLLIVTALIGVAAGVGLYLLLREEAPQFTSEAQLRYSAAITNAASTATSVENLNDTMQAYIQNEVRRIPSDDILSDAMKRQAVRQTTWFQQFEDTRAAIEQLQAEAFTASPERGTTLVTLRLSLPQGGDAPVVLNEIIDVYLTTVRIENENMGGALRGTYAAEHDRSLDAIRQTQDRIRQFLVQNDIESLSAGNDRVSIEYQNLARRQLELRAYLGQATASFEGLAKAGVDEELQPSDSDLYQLDRLPGIERIDERLRNLRTSRRAAIEGGRGEEHSEIQQIDALIASAEREKQDERVRLFKAMHAARVEDAGKQVESLKAQLAATELQFQESAAQMTDLQSKLTQYRQMQDELLTAQANRDRYQQLLDEFRVLANRPDNLRVRRQINPTQAVMTFPKPTMVIPAVTLLLLGSVGGLLFLKEMLDQRMMGPGDVRMLGETPLLGLLPHSKMDPSGERDVDRVVERHPTGLMAESYRQVRTAILSKMDRRGYKTLVVAGAKPGAGTSSVVHNIASSLAFNGRRVLIVDANFRRPKQHTLMDVSNDLGLVDVLRDRAELHSVIHTLPELALSVLPAGQAGDAPPELLEGQAFRSLLGQLETQFDTIVIDAPPALLTSECQLLAKHVDAIALVVKAGSDKRGMVERMLRQLDGQRADVLGIILNGVKASAGGYFAKSYAEFYQYNQPHRGGRKEVKRLGSSAGTNGDAPPPTDGDRGPTNGRKAKALTASPAVAVAEADAAEEDPRVMLAQAEDDDDLVEEVDTLDEDDADGHDDFGPLRNR